MKIAKRVLAVAMAVAMIAALSAMAFAAGPQVVLEPAVDGNNVAVTVYFVNAVGLKSFDLKIKYDNKALKFEYNDPGADADQVGKTKSNAWNEDINSEDGPDYILYSGYFKTELKSSADFAADAKKAGTVNINSDKFAAVVLNFTVTDLNATKADFSVEVTAKEGVELTGSTASATLKAADSGDKKDGGEKKDGTPVEEGTKEANPGTGDKKTGDNMALAAAGAVVVLAGAAFVISKKRK